MRQIVTITTCALILVLAAGTAFAQDSEQDILNRYIQQTEKKHAVKYGWTSVTFGMDRINRDNTYNTFATYESQNIDGGEFNWLNMGTSFGAEFAMIFRERFAWTVGGEYWLKMGSQLDGDYTYLPTATTLENPSTEIQVYGFSSGLQYFLINPPDDRGKLHQPAVRLIGTAGFYFANWELFSAYQNLNLSTSTPEGENAAYKGSAPGFSLGFGADYPINVWGLALGADMSYLYLNFDNVSWYNAQDEEIVASYNGTEDGRVDLNVSGFRGRIELKKYLSW